MQFFPPIIRTFTVFVAAVVFVVSVGFFVVVEFFIDTNTFKAENIFEREVKGVCGHLTLYVLTHLPRKLPPK